MRNTYRILTLSIIGLAIAGVAYGQSGNSVLTPDFSQPLSIEEIAHLTYMLEEEKLARDVYENLFEEWGNPVFGHIASAEQRHMDGVMYVMEAYGLNVELGENGEFSDPDLAAAYGQLMASGTESELQALYTGALVEEVDIQDLVLALNDSENPILQDVFGNLMRGSRNHLRAFAGLIEAQGIVYEAQLLTQDEVDAILDSPRERGRRSDGQSRGANRGTGNGPHNGSNGGFGGKGNGAGMGPGNGTGPGNGSCPLG
jgi:hypothetical protein